MKNYVKHTVKANQDFLMQNSLKFCNVFHWGRTEANLLTSLLQMAGTEHNIYLYMWADKF